ncbi:hypothetical protein BST27_06830 [Mycobacterium intermedium]|uniref:ANTAR domain-containing protein n=1 Tax=Mycobacterium intermedium TaxID=28445 RepID=A0A1E3SIY6_MYCIE|nr:GAF and ANTAR domain-containing protein [Mycobacterium intermedium]MCV6967235.1 GAF and ANTAR domain-containing protein [Mycobacterium intermedium]ODR02052.1 histidine kinase [Mycobacterium intermedium]OPE50221.1 hypothetical protein BV508_11070 [Mycobacterium intermedium]ORB08993.1 hypothetical protein BST27_06830 [Mycobacterium intermedium]
MAKLAQTTATPRTVEEILQDVTAAAIELIPGTDTAGVLLIHGNGKFESLGSDGELPAKLDQLQHDFQEGPCAQAALQDTIVRTDDFRTEKRWPRYSPAAIELGVLSGLSFKLYTADRTAGALNLFGFQPNIWDAEAETIGTVLAAHAAAAILAGRHDEQLHAALSSRDRIGQAKGIIMERFGVDDLRAFDMLRALSQEGNAKLVDVAQRVIDTSGNNALD